MYRDNILVRSLPQIFLTPNRSPTQLQHQKMASFSSCPIVIRNPISFGTPKSTTLPRRTEPLILVMAQKNDTASDKTTKLVTFLGKGGSGKTTSAVFAAQHYAMAGLSTCLVIHTQDPTAEFLLDCKIGSSPVVCNTNLSALRFETTKMLLEPLNRLKQADAHLNMTQGVLEKIVGEELGVLPGMDSIFSAYSLERLVGISGLVAKQNHKEDKFDIIVYDGMSSDEILRMISAASKARLYLKYLRNVAEKTDLGRLAGPSLLRLVDEAMDISGPSFLNGKISAEIWDSLERMLERGSSAFSEPQKFGCFLVMDPDNRISIKSALRYWGCAIQAGAHVSGALGVGSPCLNAESRERVEETFSPLPFALIPHLSFGSVPDWNTIMLNTVNEDARNLLSMATSGGNRVISPVEFDAAKKTVTLLMPGFDKSEIKLYQYRGGSELLVEVGDQRRVIQLPSKIQGRVGGAKFIDRSLVITLR